MSNRLTKQTSEVVIQEMVMEHLHEHRLVIMDSIHFKRTS